LAPNVRFYLTNPRLARQLFKMSDLFIDFGCSVAIACIAFCLLKTIFNTIGKFGAAG
jgi:hypothetical protein